MKTGNLAQVITQTKQNSRTIKQPCAQHTHSTTNSFPGMAGPSSRREGGGEEGREGWGKEAGGGLHGVSTFVGYRFVMERTMVEERAGKTSFGRGPGRRHANSRAVARAPLLLLALAVHSQRALSLVLCSPHSGSKH